MIKITFATQKPKDKKTGMVALVPGQETFLHLMPEEQKLVRIGIGAEPEKITRRKLINLIRRIVIVAKSHKLQKVALDLKDLHLKHLKLEPGDLGELLGVNWEMANFDFVEYKAKPKEGFHFLEEIILVGNAHAAFKKGVQKGQLMGEHINNCRRLCNIPGGEMTPRLLAEEAKKAARNTKVKVQILGLKEITKLKMGGLLSVASGSVEEPRFIILEYKGGGAQKPVVLVGKGITFDSGGLSLKPGNSLLDMHLDMTGGAVVIETVILAAKLGLKQNVIGLVPAAENMPSGSSYRPNDIVRTMSGLTVEVLNTDAEGRMVLCDGLTYAKRYNPRLVVDIATLTGAALVAVGKRASVILTKDEKLQTQLMALGEESGDYVWPLPLWEEFEDEVKGTFADLANIGKSRWGGTIEGAVFLYHFAKDFPAWVHIDNAPRMVAVEGEYLAKGATGEPLRLLIKLLEAK